MKHKVGLIILDGWGIGDKSNSDAIFNADTPYMDSLLGRYPNATLLTSGEDVGLPENVPLYAAAPAYLAATVRVMISTMRATAALSIPTHRGSLSRRSDSSSVACIVPCTRPYFMPAGELCSGT